MLVAIVIILILAIALVLITLALSNSKDYTEGYANISTANNFADMRQLTSQVKNTGFTEDDITRVDRDFVVL